LNQATGIDCKFRIVTAPDYRGIKIVTRRIVRISRKSPLVCGNGLLWISREIMSE
jgi:hypothetical protein